MLKDWAPVTGKIDGFGDLEFVEFYWTERFRTGIGEDGLVQSVQGRDEYAVMQRFLPKLKGGGRLLDGGCGRGEWTVLLTEHGYDVTGLDISRELVGKLREFFPKCTFDRGDIRRTGYEDGRFDLYFSWGAFEHFEEGLGSCLKEAHRIIGKGGLLLFSVPFANRRHVRSRARKKTGDSPTADAPPVRFYQYRFSVTEIAEALKEAGFEVLDVLPIHKDEGLRRMFSQSWRLPLKPGGLLEGIALRLGRALVPSGYVSHMLLGIGRKVQRESDAI